MHNDIFGMFKLTGLTTVTYNSSHFFPSNRNLFSMCKSACLTELRVNISVNLIIKYSINCLNNALYDSKIKCPCFW